MEDFVKKIYNDVLADHANVVALRRAFHAHPETAREEFATAARIEEELDKLGLSHRRVGETGVYAELRGGRAGDGVVLLRADIDALDVEETNDVPYRSRCEGKMHACGHDAHAAGLLGAARVLVKNRDAFGGTVRLCFQQGEEIGYGGRIFVKEGLVDGVDRAYGVHVSPHYDVGTVIATPGPNNASVDFFRITVHGKGAHVSTPESGVDAAYIAAQIVVAAQAIATRQTNPMDSLIVGIGKVTAGTAYNVVAEHAEIEGTVRALTPEVRRATKARVQTLAETTAALYGGTATVEWQDFTSPLINDKTAAGELAAVATELFGADKVITDAPPALGGDDFAEFLLRAKGAYAYIGTRNPNVPSTGKPQHNGGFDIDEDALTVGAALLAAATVRALRAPRE